MTDRWRVRRVAAGVLAWVLFALGWSLALRRGGDGAADGAVVLLLSSSVALVVTVAWQCHNRAIYRRKGPRRTPGGDERRWERDRLGHRLVFQDGLGVVTEVVVGMDADVKTYRAVP